MLELENRVRHSGLEQNLLGLAKIRACKVLGCVTCFGMHIRDATERGESQERIRRLDSWREASCYSEREQVALAWAEELTELASHDAVSDALYERASKLFDDAALVDLTLLVVAINGWNRINIASRNLGGNYRPAKH